MHRQDHRRRISEGDGDVVFRAPTPCPPAFLQLNLEAFVPRVKTRSPWLSLQTASASTLTAALTMISAPCQG